MEDFLNKLFISREIAHVLHLKTEHLSIHKALNDYYDAIIPLIDGLAEAYQGQYGILDLSDILHVKDKVDFKVPLKYFKSLSDFLLDNRDKVVEKKSKHLSAIIDEIVILVFQTIYKIEYLGK